MSFNGDRRITFVYDVNANALKTDVYMNGA